MHPTAILRHPELQLAQKIGPDKPPEHPVSHTLPNIPLDNTDICLSLPLFPTAVNSGYELSRVRFDVCVLKTPVDRYSTTG